jgi:hypothetical protein
MGVLGNVAIRGSTGAILWGANWNVREAATIRQWIIVHHKPDQTHDGRWRLSATFARADKFRLRQRPLLFTGKREGLKGLWCFPLVTETIQIGDTQLVATLGPPER